MKQKILVIGSTNFVGKCLIENLNASDWALPMPCTCIGKNRKFGIRELANALYDVNAVINCTMGTPASIEASAKMLTKAIEITNHRIRIVHISSMTVYGTATGEIDEQHTLSDASGRYATAHIQAEQYLADHPNKVIIRPACEYGPYCTAWSERIARWLQSGRLGDLGAAGDGDCNLIFIEDLCTAVLKSVRLPDTINETLNLGAATMTWNEYFVAFAKILGATPIRRISKRRLMFEQKYLAAPLKLLELSTQQMFGTSSKVPGPITSSFLTTCSQEIRLLNSKATTLLDMRWTPVHIGLELTAKWLQENAR